MKSSSHGRITSAIPVPSRFTLKLTFTITILAAVIIQAAFTFARPGVREFLVASTYQMMPIEPLLADPIPQTLPYSQDFSGLPHSSVTFPDGWQGWQIGTGTAAGSSAVFKTIAPTSDLNLTANGSASSTGSAVYNFNGKLGTLSSGSVDPSLVLAINTIGSSGVNISFDVMTIRNPYNGTTNTRINEVDLQYRVCSSLPCDGAFASTSASPGIYQNNTTSQTNGTNPQNPETKMIALPTAVNNHANVQLRWVQRDVSGGGARPSFAVDNISVTDSVGCTPPVITLEPADQTVTYGAPSVSFTSNASGDPTPAVQWEVNSGSGFAPLANGGGVAGADTSTVTIANPTVVLSDNEYRAVFTNECGGTQSATSSSASLTIAPLLITITPDPGQAKGYGDVDPPLTYEPSPALVGSDTFSGMLSRDPGEAVGQYIIMPGTLSAGPNYILDLTPAATFTITARALDASITANDREYDGTTVATFGCSLAGIVGTDDVSCAGGMAAFASDDVGVHTVTATGLGLTGADAGNYSLPVTTATDDAEIFVRSITVTAVANSRPYDGTTVSSALPVVTAGSIAAGDAESFSQNFDTKHVGTGKTITPSGLVSDGSGGSNYAITFIPVSLGSITATPITITAVATTKVFDGNTSSPGIPMVSPALIDGDLPNFIQTYDTPVVGTGKTITPSGTADDGNGGANYSYSFVSVDTGVITTAATYCFDGFLSPIGGSVESGTGGSFSDPVRAFKLNSTIPIKFSLFSGGCGGSPIVTGVHTLQVIKYADAVDSGPAIDATPTDAATTGNQFRLVDTEWHYNLDTRRTPGLSAGTWLVKATLFDGSVRTVWISIKR
ncbi:MAG TPA: YDG domain-containing protein [Pyrinomonadaceae bacterium]